MRGTAIRAGLVAVSATAALVSPWALPAVAGGGCHAGLTQGRGESVEMVKACFSPSILRVDSGTEVTFVNRDPLVHNLSSNGWGQYEDMYEGDTFTATFNEPGIYPFACTYHPGMTGAVVVGDGTGPGSGELVTGGSSTDLAETDPVAASDTGASVPTSGSGSAAGWIGGGVLGLAIGAGLGLVARRRHEQATGG